MLTSWQLQIIDIAIKEFGYNNFEIIHMNNEILGSELCLYTRVAFKKAILAIKNNKSNYAYLFTDDGDFVHGTGFVNYKDTVGVC